MHPAGAIRFVQGDCDSGGARVTKAFKIRCQAVATSALCQKPVNCELDPSVFRRAQQDWTTWTARVGRLSARLYSIHTEALHKETSRGSISSKYTNIQDVREPILLLSSACEWWRRTVTANGFVETEENDEVTVQMPEDEDYEAFYDKHFPDDIPDEWPLAEQQKSHGRGHLETAKEPMTPYIRDEKVSDREWIWGIHVPARKS